MLEEKIGMPEKKNKKPNTGTEVGTARRSSGEPRFWAGPDYLFPNVKAVTKPAWNANS